MKSKRCLECGKLFTPRCGTQQYCSGPHVTTCRFCNKIFEYAVRPSEKPQTCSVSCRKNLKALRLKEKYGVTNVSQIQSVREKISRSNSSEEVKKKRAETCMCRWNVDNPSKNEDIRKKLSSVMKTEEYLKNREATCIERYGVRSPMQVDTIKAKQRATNQLRYSMNGHPHTKEDFMKMMKDPSKVAQYLAFKQDPRGFIQSTYDSAPSIIQLEQDLGVTNTPIYDILVRENCRDLLATTYSTMEDDVVNYIQTLDSNICIQRNNRTIIKPLEIDIYLPEYKLGIECNPVATHNSSFVDPWGSPCKPYDYHQKKSLASYEAGVFLFHIFGYEWNNKQEILKSMIANLLGKNNASIGARNTYVCELDNNTCKDFLNANHRQGYTVSSIRIGLRMKDTGELVSVMTFSAPRPTLGRGSSNCEYELTRFCSKLHTSVIGGASKLFTYFVSTYHPNSVSSFSDVAHTRGGLYSRLGFQKITITAPSYVWVDLYDAQYYHRVACQKHNLSRLLGDSALDLTMTEKEIMESHKYARVYDSGVIKWVYMKPSDFR